MARQRPATHGGYYPPDHAGGNTPDDEPPPVPFSRLVLHPDRLTQPLHWTKPRVVLVASRGDLFHDAVPDEYIDQVFGVMAVAERHIFLVLTKRAERLCSYLNDEGRNKPIGFERGMGLHHRWAREAGKHVSDDERDADQMHQRVRRRTPILPNVYLGVSVTGQDDRWRIEKLCQTPAAHRFVSYEPALADLGDVSQWLGPGKVEWVIVGAESGAKRRPCERAWWSNVLKSCRDAGIPGYLKQRPELMGIKSTTDGDHILDCSGKLLHFPPTAADVPADIWRLLEGKR